MKQISILLQLIVILLCISCQDEPVIQRNEESASFRFTIVSTEEGIVDTRANEVEDNKLQNIYVVVFDSERDDASIIDWAQAKSSGSNNVYYANLRSETTSGYMFVLANIETELTTDIETLKTSKLKAFKENFMVKLTQDNNNNITNNPVFAPKVSDGLTYNKSDGSVPTFILKRSNAKVTIINESNDANYKILGANLGNAPLTGYVFDLGKNTDSKLIANYAGQESANNYSVEKMISGVSADNINTTEPLYLYESPAANQTFVIVKGEYKGVTGFHKLNLIDKNNKSNFLNITRNYQYIIHITQVATTGYSTAAEAIKNEASNIGISYDITVTNSSHDIITNGKNYLGVSNSSLIVYQTGSLSDFTATQLSYTTESTWNAGIITANGEGLTLSNGTSQMTLDQGSVSDKNININCSDKFTSGTLTIRIGDLCKIIQVTKYNNLAAVPNEMEFNNATVGDCSESGALKNEIRFSESSGKYTETADSEIFVSGTKKIFTIVSANVGYPEPNKRSGEFYVASAEDHGRTKIYFNQEGLNVYKGSIQIQPYTYVATFHRWNQTAERIIRVQTISNDPDALWTARVVVGESFIQLDEHRSPDDGITMYPYGCDNLASPTIKDNAKWTSDNDIETNCQFTQEQKGKILVTGNGNSVYFRVSMKSQLSSAESQPRYGLIALNYQNYTGAQATHLIYVRQGEAADYLMRPNDPVETKLLNQNIQIPKRTFAAKILPYNVTVPDAQKGNIYYDIPESGEPFTDYLTNYPSQGGYLFFGKSRRAIFAKGATIGSKSSTPGDPCPKGYREIQDAEATLGVEGTVQSSELRQTIWLNPLNGSANSNFDNLLRGYIADGYYDRRTMRVPNTQSYKDEGRNPYTGETIIVNGTPKKYTVPTLVSDGALIGYAGLLVYNPYNYATIFMPSTGSWQNTWEYFLTGVGYEVNIWTSTYSSHGDGTSFPWYMATGNYVGTGSQNNSFVFDAYNQSAARYYAFTIRCVKKDN